MHKAIPEPDSNNTHRQRIGRRLAAIRDELGRGQRWTQEQVAARTGLTQNIISRIEKSGAGAVENWLVLMAFYQQQGYTLNWILSEDNTLESKLYLDELKEQGGISAEALQRDILEEVEQLQKTVNRKLDPVQLTDYTKRLHAIRKQLVTLRKKLLNIPFNENFS